MSTQVGVGISHHRNPQVAGQEAVQQALKKGGMDKADFVFMYATVAYNQQAIVKAVRGASGGAGLCGCSGEGVIVEKQPDESPFAVGVLAIRSDEMRFQNGIATGLKQDPSGAGQAIAQAIQPIVSAESRALFIFPDALTVNFDKLVSGLEGGLTLDHHLPLVGGTAGDNWEWKQTYQYCDDKVVSDGVAWALLSGQVQVATAVNHGCLPIGIERKVTKAEGNTIYEIDNKPVLEALKDYYTADEIADWGKAIVNLPLGFEAPKDMNGYDQHLIRVITSRDDATGSVTIPDEVTVGASVYITRRDYDKVVAGVDRLTSQLHAQLGGQKPKLAFQFECAGRGKVFLRDQQKLQLLEQLQQRMPDVPWFGFFTYGEIGPVEGQNCFHNYTSVVTALY